jgi:hypothetical protein
MRLPLQDVRCTSDSCRPVASLQLGRLGPLADSHNAAKVLSEYSEAEPVGLRAPASECEPAQAIIWNKFIEEFPMNISLLERARRLVHPKARECDRYHRRLE